VNPVEVAEYDTTAVCGPGQTRSSVKVVPEKVSSLDSVTLCVPPSTSGVMTSFKHPPAMTMMKLTAPGGGPPSRA
jgi:hypothetical protein